MRRLILLTIAMGLWPGWAWAAGSFRDCTSLTTSTGGNAVSGGDLDLTVRGSVCYQFDDATNSGYFSIAAPRGFFRFDPHTGSDGADDAQVNIRYCPPKGAGSATAANVCIPITASPLTGAKGNDAVCGPPGIYYIEVTTTPGASDHAYVAATGVNTCN